MRVLIKIFKALSDPNRLRIVKMLQIRPLCVCEITAVLNLSGSTASKHLSILRDAELILDEKQGKWVSYRLNPTHAQKYVGELLPLLAQWLPNEKIILNDAEAVKRVDRYLLQAA